MANAVCKNSFGGFSCVCGPGYTGDGKVGCKNLCETKACANNVYCTINGLAPNTGGANGAEAVCDTAHCKPGYVHSPDTGNPCIPITGGECGKCDGAGTDDDPGAVCVGNAGSAACECASGSGTVGSCDVDECATNNGGCGTAANHFSCINLPIGHACGCQPGYVRDGAGACVDVNECNEQPGPCHPNATCTNTAGSFTCACKDGYTGDGSVCKDVDECAAKTDNCADDGTAHCVNTPGGFSCPCARGYTGDGTKGCTDLDECKKGVDDCADNATCTNTTPDKNPFGYSCVCPTGLGGDGFTCADVDECKNASLFDCPANSACVNDDPGYHCACAGEFAGDKPDECYCDLTGYWAVRQDVDLCWCDRVLSDVTIISGGSTEATIWELHKLSYDGKKIVVEKKGCGSDNEPDFVSPFFKSCPRGEASCPEKVAETYSSYAPLPAFDKLDLAKGQDIPEAGIVPGSMFTTPKEAAVVGMDLGDDPENAVWPAPFTVGHPTVNPLGGDAPAWTDIDGDGEPGFTFWPKPPSKETERSTSAARRYYFYTPIDVADENGGTVVTKRAGCLSVATRIISHLNADVESCDRIVGSVVNDKTEGRVEGCVQVAKADWNDDKTCTADDWSAATRCTADDIERFDATDQSNTTQATFEMVKIGKMGDDIDCADVRKALPALKRDTPTPISCQCQ